MHIRNSKKLTVALATVLVGAVLGCAQSRNRIVAEPIAAEPPAMFAKVAALEKRLQELEHQILVLEERNRQGAEVERVAREGTREAFQEGVISDADIPVVKLSPGGYGDEGQLFAVEHAPAVPQKNARVRPTSAKPSFQKIAKKYDAILQRYRSGDCQESLMAFDAFQKEFPESSFADNALYWMGECYFNSRDYALAVDEFQKIIRLYPKENKVPDALYRLGLSYKALATPEKAKAYFQRILDEHPRSELQTKAMLELRSVSQGGF